MILKEVIFDGDEIGSHLTADLIVIIREDETYFSSRLLLEHAHYLLGVVIITHMMREVEASPTMSPSCSKESSLATCPLKTPNLIVQKSFLKDKALTLFTIEQLEQIITCISQPMQAEPPLELTL